MINTVLTIVDYQSIHQPWFEKLNRSWIEKYFEMEPIDIEMLKYPEDHIIQKGGFILMALHDKQIVGTTALKFIEPGLFEFTKMAVDEKFRGQKIGQALAEAAIKKAKQSHAHTVILYSNTVLKPAIELYKKLGFKEVPVDGPYTRSNIKMQLHLAHPIPLTVGNDKMQFRLRDATLQDITAIVDIYNSTIPGRMVTADTIPVSVESKVQWFEEHTSFKRPLWVVENNESKVMGWVSFQSFYGRPAYDGTAEISIYVHEEARGKGLGRSLLQYAVMHAPQLGIKTLLGFIFAHNEPSLKLFKQAGFQQWALLPDVAVLDEIKRSLIILGKRIVD